MSATAIAQDLWEQVKDDLRSSFPEDLYRMWFDRLVMIERTETACVLAAPNEMIELWVTENYLDVLAQKFRQRLGTDMQVRVRHVDGACPTGAVNPTPEPEVVRTPRRLRVDTASSFAATLNPKNTFETFIVGANNEMAHAAAMSVARAPASAYNPLLIYGETGLGKTHLMHAIGHYLVRSRPDARVAYVTSEKFTNDFITALGEASLPKFRQRYRGVDMLLIDDIQFFGGKERAQEEFFHTFNDLSEAGKQIVLTSDRPVNEIDKLEKRLLTRFNWGMTADIRSPDLETRIAILRRKAASQGFAIPDPILTFIAERISSNIRQLEGALIKVGSYARLTNRTLDLSGVSDLLRDVLIEEARKQLTIEMIQKRVADHFGLRTSDMVSRRRPNNIAQPRQIAMYLARELTRHSLQEIGEAFGGRDHGTVIHACRTVQNTMEQDTQFRTSVTYLHRELAR